MRTLMTAVGWLSPSQYVEEAPLAHESAPCQSICFLHSKRWLPFALSEQSQGEPVPAVYRSMCHASE